MDQNPLFTESIYTALDDIVRACGGYKKVAGILWPKKSTGYASLKNKLNVEHHEKFDLEELLQLLSMGREAGCHTAIYFLADETGYERPKIAAPKSPKALLLERQAKLAVELSRLQEEIDLLGNTEALRSVR